MGSILHTTVELMANETKTKFLHIPYRGEAPAITGLLQGDIDFIAATSGPISPRIRSGEFRALAVTGKTRWRDFPDVPTVEEQGIPGFEVISWSGLAGPAKLPRPIVDKLNAELRRAIAVPEREEQARGHGRRSARHHARRDARAGGEPARDLDQARQGDEHLDRLKCDPEWATRQDRPRLEHVPRTAREPNMSPWKSFQIAMSRGRSNESAVGPIWATFMFDRQLNRIWINAHRIADAAVL